MGGCCSYAAEDEIAFLQEEFVKGDADSIVGAVYAVRLDPENRDPDARQVRAFVTDFVVAKIVAGQDDLAIRLMQVLARWGRGKKRVVQDVVTAAALRLSLDTVHFVTSRGVWAVLGGDADANADAPEKGLSWDLLRFAVLPLLPPSNPKTMDFIVGVYQLLEPVHPGPAQQRLCGATTTLLFSLLKSKDPAAPAQIVRLVRSSGYLGTPKLYSALVAVAIALGNQGVCAALLAHGAEAGADVPWAYFVACALVAKSPGPVHVRWILDQMPPDVDLYPVLLYVLCQPQHLADLHRASRECLDLLNLVLPSARSGNSHMLFRAALATEAFHPVAAALYDPETLLPSKTYLLPATFKEFVDFRSLFGWTCTLPSPTVSGPKDFYGDIRADMLYFMGSCVAPDHTVLYMN
jgi:hypothetical protein